MSRSKQDIFADIAAQRAAARRTDLEQPQPPQLPERVLPVHAGAAAAFTPLPKMTTADQLQAELERQRQRYAPFLEDQAPALESYRTRQLLQTFDWRLETADDRRNFSGVLTGGGAWQPVTIPHYGGPLGQAVAYYRATFALNADDLARGAIFVCFKGVDYKAHVFVNGAYLGSHEGFFAPFEFDLTACARAGANTLTVKVENDFICMGSVFEGDPHRRVTGDKLYAATGPGYDDPEVGWHHCPPGMGIYQEVCIETRSRLHLRDLFVRPIPEEDRAEAWIEVHNCDPEPQAISLELAVYGQNFRQTILHDLRYEPDSRREVGLGDSLTEAQWRATGELEQPVPLLMEKGVNYLRVPFAMPEARLWDVATPWLYQLQVRLRDGAVTFLDAAKQQFGMRSFRLDTDTEPKGMFFLNGRPLRLRGANTMGHEQQCVITRDWDQLRDDILLAKIGNMNFLRLTQRPVQPEVYDFCDRLGLMTQTDLPLFGVLRRNQFCEAVRQAAEMERLVRAHPCNVLVSYINEPFPNARNQPHRHLLRQELEDFFAAATLAVRLHNPDRVIKPVDGDYDPPCDGLPDNHCYTTWYNGHGVDVGQLHKGFWQWVKPGWNYGCGEFGAEGLDPVNVMRKYYPASWLPQSAEEEAAWSPNRIIDAQTGKFHYLFYDTPATLADWAEASQAYQAQAVRLMTEAFRRDPRMVSFAVHLFIDAFPSGWMKAIMDVDRQPKPAYFAYREALTPLMVNLRADRLTYTSGEPMRLEAWVCSDLAEILPAARLRYECRVGQQVLASGETAADIPSNSSRFQGFLTLPAPDVAQRTALTIRMGLLEAAGTVRHDTDMTLEIFPALPDDLAGTAYIAGPTDGRAARLADDMALTPVLSLQEADVIVIDDYAAFTARERDILNVVRGGGRAIFLELPVGTYAIAGSVVQVKTSGMSPLYFVSRNTGHPLVRGFRPHDFSYWYDPALDRIAPMLWNTFTADDFAPVLTSGNTNAAGEWGPALAVGEKTVGQGRITICQAALAGRTSTNPVAAIFARRLIAGKLVGTEP